MAAHLLVISLGPVQGFIAQARRTRDLWFGSHLLVELSREVARSVRQAGGEPIFPDPGQLDTGAGVANKILARVEGDPGAIAAGARGAAQARLRAWGQAALDAHRDLVDPDALGAAREQLETFLEFQAAWTPCAGDADYPRALEEVESALAARRMLREFSPWKDQRGGVHKSSLDGARESVLRGGDRSGREWGRYRIGAREELDAIGLLKRTGGDPEQFVPVPTIGLADWVGRARERHAEQLARIVQACHEQRFTRVNRKAAWIQAFPFDAQLLLPDRWLPYFREARLEGAEDRARQFGQRVRPLLDALGEPFPYVACLAADGDRMGHALQAMAGHGLAAHRQLSRALSRFASEARRIVEDEHRGVLIYSGGDDVLAFLCPPDAPRCARALREAFGRAMDEALAGVSGVAPPTLSVGLGIGHVLEGLGDLLELGRGAERSAKGHGRNALALSVLRHAGRQLEWGSGWKDGPVEALEADAERLRLRKLPLGKVREIARMLQRTPEPGTVSKEEAVQWGRVLELETGRILARAEIGEGAALTPLQAGLEPGSGSYEQMRERIQEWAERVEIAQILARAGAPRTRAEGGGA